MQTATMTSTAAAAKVQTGKTYYFGWRNTPNVVEEVGAAFPNGDVPVTLRGPRGGEFRAIVRSATGKCRKI